jgi:ATP-dependent helicase HrpA
MDLRLRKLMNGNVARDTKLAEGIKDYWQRYVDMAARRRADGIHDPMLEGYRWMLEEYRVSLFAQELGTAEHVSPERLDRQWSAVRQ